MLSVTLLSVAACNRVPAVRPGRSAVVPLVTGTTADPGPPGVPEILRRGVGVLQASVLRDDTLIPGTRVRVALSSDTALVVTIGQSLRDSAGQMWVGLVDETSERMVMRYGDGTFSLVVRRPVEGDIEVSGCHGEQCTVTHFRPRMPVRCSTRPSRSASTTVPSDGQAATIDVLVLYTDAVVEKWSSWANTTTATKEIQEWVDDTNTSFTCSRVNARVRLASVAKVPFAESGNLEADLKTWTNATGAEWPQIAVLRGAVGADLVTVVVSQGDNHGIANSYDLSPAVSLVVRDVALGGLHVFSHEIGHLLGAGHQQGDDKGWFPDSYAWRFFKGLEEHLTIMHTKALYRAPQYSNPDVCYDGKRTGATDIADNVRAMNAIAATVEAYSNPIVHETVGAIACPYNTTCPVSAR